MRWMLLKDLQILWRSKLLLGLLIVYPIAIATLMGFALSSGPEKPRVAFLNQVPENRSTIRLGDQKHRHHDLHEQALHRDRAASTSTTARRRCTRSARARCWPR